MSDRFWSAAVLSRFPTSAPEPSGEPGNSLAPLRALHGVSTDQGRIELFQRFEHCHDVFFRHPWTCASADRKNNPLAAAFLQHFEGGFAYFLRSAPYANFQRIHIPHQAHAI